MTIDPTASQLAARGVAFAPEIASAAERHGLNPSLLAAVAAQETGGPDTDSGHNILGDGGHGHGLFQIDDRWHSFARTREAMDPERNADYAATMLSGLLSRYGGDVHAALSAYNAGSPNAVGTKTRWDDGRDLGYADSVLAHYARITGSSAVPVASTGGSPGAGSGAVGQTTSQGAWQELAALIASLGALESPMLQPPQPVQPQPYQPQAIDYGGLIDGND